MAKCRHVITVRIAQAARFPSNEDRAGQRNGSLAVPRNHKRVERIDVRGGKGAGRRTEPQRESAQHPSPDRGRHPGERGDIE